jgi:hypothetical protein
MMRPLLMMIRGILAKNVFVLSGFVPTNFLNPCLPFCYPCHFGGLFRATSLQPASIAANRIFGRATVARQVRYNWSQQTERGHGNALALSQDRTANQQPLCFHFQIINPAP